MGGGREQGRERGGTEQDNRNNREGQTMRQTHTGDRGTVGVSFYNDRELDRARHVENYKRGTKQKEF